MTEAEQLWNEAEQVFPASDLDGVYDVVVLSGKILKLFNLERFKDRKTIWGGSGKNTLVNLFNIDWGYFDVEVTDTVLLNYRCGTIRDYVRKVGPGRFIGEFYLKIKDEWEFMGLFELRKT